MGLGDFPFGEGGFGEDPVAPHSPAQNLTPPAAAYFDLGLQNFVVSADGTQPSMHPNDQAVQWSFAVRRGTLNAHPAVGHTLFEQPPLSGDAKQKDLELRAVDAYPFSRLIDGKAVAFEGVSFVEPKPGETRIAIHYRNLQLDPTQVRTAIVNG